MRPEGRVYLNYTTSPELGSVRVDGSDITQNLVKQAPTCSLGHVWGCQDHTSCQQAQLSSPSVSLTVPDPCPDSSALGPQPPLIFTCVGSVPFWAKIWHAEPLWVWAPTTPQVSAKLLSTSLHSSSVVKLVLRAL
mmetsp:Transcript_58899/g.149213  ORF Transcript_58899/g.149213 Transcript_58899/m.149213 type:complete len:135 (+) Transcript_58899:354-758(+)